jgi:hypothetical protein
MQDLIDMMNKIIRNTRKDYHLTLNKLISALKAEDSTKTVMFDTDQYPDAYPHNICSYRGFYQDLAISETYIKRTCGGLLDECDKISGQVLRGYRGGEFTMDPDAPLWKAEWGMTGPAIVDVRSTDQALILVTRYVD